MVMVTAERPGGIKPAMSVALFPGYRNGEQNKWNVRRALSMNRTFTMSALKALSIAALISGCSALNANNSHPKFRVIAFFTAKQDPAHISFVHEANRWFPEMAAKYNFSHYSTSDWQNLNSDFLAKYQVVV